VLALAGIAYFVDLFLRWNSLGGSGVRFTGWDLTIGLASGQAVIALLLVELLRATGVWCTRATALLVFFLGAGTALLAVSALVHLHWGGFYHLPLGEFSYGAWLALTLALVLAIGAMLALADRDVHMESGERVHSAT
jgi:hypothetical protein